MMPSRGIALARGNASSLCRLQSRNLSSSSRPLFRPTRKTPSTSVLNSQNFVTPIALSAFVAARNASSATPSTVSSASPTVPSANDAASSLNTVTNTSLDTITLNHDAITLDLLNKVSIVDGPGYLHSIGLDFGLGTTSIVQWLVEHAHFDLGLSWWAAAAMVGVSLRLVLLPLFIRQADVIARQAAMGEVLKPMMEEIQDHNKRGDAQAAALATRRMWAVRKEAGLSLKDQFLPMVVQAVIGFSGFRLLRNMAELPVPGLSDSGPLWITDLTATDPFFALPMLMGITLYSTVRLGGESGATNLEALPKQMKYFMLYGMPGLIVAITIFQPGLLLVWFCSTGAVGLTQGYFLQKPSVRKFLNIAPTFKPKPSEGELNPLLHKAQQNFQQILDPKKQDGSSNIDEKPIPRSGKPRMRLDWQAPNIKTTNSSSNPKVIDVKLAPSADKAASEPTHFQKSVKKAWDRTKEYTENKKRIAAKKSQEKAAFEERAKKNGGKR